MTQDFQTIFKKVLADRTFVALILVLAVLTIGFCIYVALSLQPNDLQLAVRYTAFGETNYYRDRWFYLLTFIGFGLLTLIINTSIAIKLLLIDKRLPGIAVLWFGLLLLGVTWIITRSVLGIALL